MSDWGNVRFVVLKDFDACPVHLLEQVKDRNWKPEVLKRWGKAIGANPFNVIIGAMDEDRMVGIMWGTIDPVSEGVFINIVSVEKEYQDGRVIQRAVEFFKGVAEDVGLSKVYALTSRPRAGLRLGWKKTKMELMEV